MPQLLTFTVAGHDYAIESRQVVEVLPLVPARPVPHMPPYMRGMFTYRGGLVPLLDLGLRLAGRPPAERLSTRVLVVDASLPEPRHRITARLGLVAEHVLAIRSADDAAARHPLHEPPDAPYLGPLLRLDGQTIQLLDVGRLLPPDLAEALYPDPPGTIAR